MSATVRQPNSRNTHLQVTFMLEEAQVVLLLDLGVVNPVSPATSGWKNEYLGRN
jgi:hypothetical protein